MQKDVSTLSETLTDISVLMQEAFDTSSVEANRAMGISGKDFVMRLTEAAKELPRVESGIKNGIGNAIDSLKQSAGKFGLAINQAFNVTGAIEAFSGAVLTIANAFSSLDPNIQKTILATSALAIATGPVVRAYGSMQLLLSESIGVWRGLITRLGAAATAFKALDATMKLTVIGAVITAVAALTLAYQHYAGRLTDVERVQQSLANIEKTAAANTASQKSEIELLVAAYKKEGTTLEQKQGILAKLKQISPEYFGQIRAGKGDIDAITKSTAAYTAELFRLSKVKAAKDRIDEIEKTLLNLKEVA